MINLKLNRFIKDLKVGLKVQKVLKSEKSHILSFPGTWNHLPLGEKGTKIGRFGYGSFVLKVKGLKKGLPLGLNIKAVSSNYRLFIIQGDKIHRMGGLGKVGEREEETLSQFGEMVEDFINEGEEFTILINASNYFYRGGGLIGHLYLGPKRVVRDNYERRKLRDFFYLGIVFIVGIIHFGIFYQRKEDRGSFWFGLFCFMMASRYLSVGSYFDILFPSPSKFSFYLNRKIEFLSYYLAVPVFFEFLKYLFSDYFPERFMKYLWRTCFFFAGIVLLTPPYIFYETLLAFEVITVLLFIAIIVQLTRASLKKVPHGQICLGGIFILFFGVGWDILVFRNLVPQIELYLVSSITFVFIQSYIISVKFSNTYKLVEKHNTELEYKVAERTKEISKFLDNLQSAIFSVGPDLNVIPPYSVYSRTLFNRDITNLNVFDFLFPHYERDSRKFNETNLNFQTIFGDDELNYTFVEGNFPTSTSMRDPERPEGKILKIAYTPFYSLDGKVERLMFLVEDITEFETYYKETRIDQQSFIFMKEALNLENKAEAFTNIESAIELGFETLDHFLSPQSGLYSPGYFMEKYKITINEIVSKVENLEILTKQIHLKTADFDYISVTGESQFGKDDGEGTDYKKEVSEKIADVLEYLINYAKVLNLFEKRKFVMIKSEMIESKIRTLRLTLKNLFEKSFLVRDLDAIDKDNLARISKLAKLYPNLALTFTLFQLRSKLIALLLEASGDNESAKAFSNLSSHLKQLPSRHKLTGTIINQHLIIPSKAILDFKNKKAA